MNLLAPWGRFVYRRRWAVLVVSLLTVGLSVASLLAGGQLPIMVGASRSYYPNGQNH